MAIPTDYIFQSGTCQKKELYDLIINKLKDAGWTDISSKPDTDFVVLTSAGNTGDKQLILNLRPLPAAATAANNVTTSDFCQMSYRLEDAYTPGAAGVAGIFGRPSLAWSDLYIAPVAASGKLALDTVVNYKVYADLSKIILVVEYPPAVSMSPILIYMGLPDTLYMPQAGNSGTLVAVTNTAITATNVQVCNTPDGIGNVTAPYALPTQTLLALKNPNNANKYMVSDVYYGSTTEGVRGKLDGIYCMPNQNIQTGDNVIINAKTYYVICCHAQGNSSFSSPALLVRIA